jgi:hypothetical protein
VAFGISVLGIDLLNLTTRAMLCNFKESRCQVRTSVNAICGAGVGGIKSSQIQIDTEVFMQDTQPRFVPLAAKTVVCHTVTYFVMGALAYHFLHYADFINNPCSGMRPITSLWVIFGPPLQIIRGILFASIFYLFRDQLFGQKNGWLRMAWMLIGIGILGTFAAPAGSLEGFIYTTTPIPMQLRGYLEIVTQALLLSALLSYWINHPGKKLLSWTLGVIYAVCVVLPMLALIAPQR